MSSCGGEGRARVEWRPGWGNCTCIVLFCTFVPSFILHALAAARYLLLCLAVLCGLGLARLTAGIVVGTPQKARRSVRGWVGSVGVRPAWLRYGAQKWEGWGIQRPNKEALIRAAKVSLDVHRHRLCLSCFLFWYIPRFFHDAFGAP